MNEQYAKQLLDLRAKRLGWKEFDHTPRNFLLQPKQTVVVDGNNQLFFVLDVPTGITVESQLGYYNDSSKDTNELDEEFFGKITITNRTNSLKRVRFLQGIPRQNGLY